MPAILYLLINSLARTSCLTGFWLNLNYNPCKIKCLSLSSVSVSLSVPKCTKWVVPLSTCSYSYLRDKLRGTAPNDWPNNWPFCLPQRAQLPQRQAERNCKKRFLLQHTCFSVPLGVVAPDALLEENTSLTPPLPGPRVLRSEAEGLPEVTTAVSAAIRSFLL